MNPLILLVGAAIVVLVDNVVRPLNTAQSVAALLVVVAAALTW